MKRLARATRLAHGASIVAVILIWAVAVKVVWFSTVPVPPPPACDCASYDDWRPNIDHCMLEGVDLWDCIRKADKERKPS